MIPTTIIVQPKDISLTAAQLSKHYMEQSRTYAQITAEAAGVADSFESLHLLIESLPEVLDVQSNLSEINEVQAKLAEITSAYSALANIEIVAGDIVAINTLYEKLTELIELHTELPELLALHLQLTELTGYESLTHSELLTLISESKLVSGSMYRITDYVTTTVQADTVSAENQFDLVVTALSVNELSANAKAVLHSGDTYFAGKADLGAWEILYTPFNDTSKFAWADKVNGKGVIYFLRDEWQNECYFDFKNIQFARTAGGVVPQTDNYYTFTWVNENNLVVDSSLVGDMLLNDEYSKPGVYGNKSKPYKHNYQDMGSFYSLYDNIFISTHSFDNGWFYGCYLNTFLSNCYSNTFGNQCSSNEFGNDCSSNEFGNGCKYNSFVKVSKDFTSITELYNKDYPHEIIGTDGGKALIRWYDSSGDLQTQLVS